jgi:hypothetical protein
MCSLQTVIWLYGKLKGGAGPHIGYYRLIRRRRGSSPRRCEFGGGAPIQLNGPLLGSKRWFGGGSHGQCGQLVEISHLYPNKRPCVREGGRGLCEGAEGC